MQFNSQTHHSNKSFIISKNEDVKSDKSYLYQNEWAIFLCVIVFVFVFRQHFEYNVMQKQKKN